jgi:hypothetical protein
VLDAGVRAILVAVTVPWPTLKVALAPVNPVAATLTEPVPVFVGVKLEVATPAFAVTGEAGLNEPVTAVTEKLIGALLVVTVLPNASSTVAV